LTPEPFRTADFEYDLPPELIAQVPLPDRGGSRLLVVRRPGSAPTRDRSALDDAGFADLAGLIPPGDLLVINTTKVRHARLLGTRPSGAPAEVLLIRPATTDTWIAIGKPGSALRPGKRMILAPGAEVETVEILADGNRLVRFVGISAEEAMKRYGGLPLPPYITRAPNQQDEIRYQTVYADTEGSVAAPTAGLHFTPALLNALAAGGVQVEGLDLQVGTGTFKPVEVDDPARHEMHPECYEIPPRLARLLEETRIGGRRVWAVGTTVVRALESAIRPDGSFQSGPAETKLMILPGYRFRAVDRLITNFHLPRSTLLMLVCAFAGRELALAAYRHAVAARYRFYSYGDAMVII
jgi:S-adenosylmethionine:tRNA ribosyltransferase-isomerase